MIKKKKENVVYSYGLLEKYVADESITNIKAIVSDTNCEIRYKMSDGRKEVRIADDSLRECVISIREQVNKQVSVADSVIMVKSFDSARWLLISCLSEIDYNNTIYLNIRKLMADMAA